MNNKLDVAILSVPYTEPAPMVAPVLISACLNKGGVSAKGIDFSIEFFKTFSQKDYWIDLKNQLVIGYVKSSKLPTRAIIDILKFNKRFLLKLKQEHNPSWIGLSIFTAESINYSYLLIYSIKKYLPDVKIVIGGKGSEITCANRNKPHYQLYVENGLADLAVVGDCEHIIADAIKENRQGIYFSTQQTKEDLDESPIPNWDEYDLGQYADFSNELVLEPYMAITASKGCVRKCTFCDVNTFWPKYIYRKSENVANEIITAYKKTGIRQFLFTDNLINGSVSHYRTFNSVLAKELPNTIAYGGNAIFRDKDTMPVEDFELAARAGCKWWAVGVESGSERVRFEVGKKITDSDLAWSVTQLAKHNIQQIWMMMVGYPTESQEDFELTLELFRKYAYLGKQGLIRPSISPTFMLLNDSPIMQDPMIRDSLGVSHNLNFEWSSKFWTTTLNADNTFPVRAQRWKQAISLLEDLGYEMRSVINMQGNDKWLAEIESLEKLYNEKKNTFIPIHQI